ncbi:MAG: hypothetical protein IPN68_18635 [Bacteroidetes bacterium]|nr:hypothetical protein [Bacteroidota bacterium]
MKYYEFLETIKQNKIHTMGQPVNMAPNLYAEMVRETVPFVFVPRDELRSVPLAAEQEILDLPFKTCFFEMLGKAITTINEDGRDAGVDGILVNEISPRTYNMLLFMYEVEDATRRHTVYAMDSKHMGELSRHMVGIVKSLLEQLTEQDAGIINPRHSVKMKINGEKIQHRINRIIYVASKKQRSEAQAHVSKEIDWSHRFEVRGHWRKVDRIGKDREGLYCVEGHTWVKEHVRGPEEMPLIKKTRIVTG